MTMTAPPDSYGRARSSRSIPTGPGSRGGSWHDPEFRRAYFRRYRATRPDYRERERERQTRRRNAMREARAVVGLSFSDGLRDFVRREVERSSYEQVARGTAVSVMTVWRFVNDHERSAWLDIIDAIIAKYGIYRLVADWRTQVRAAERAA